MARKKKEEPSSWQDRVSLSPDQVASLVEAAPPITEGDIKTEPDEPQSMNLTREEMYRLQLAQLQVRAPEAEMNLHMLQRDLYVKQIDPEGKLKQMAGMIRGRGDEAALGKKAYEAITKEIETRLGITLKEYGYDDETGLLQKVDQ